MVSLSTVCLVQWQALRKDRAHLVEAVDRASGVEKQIELAMARWLSLAEDLRREMKTIMRDRYDHPRAGGPLAESVPSAAANGESAAKENRNEEKEAQLSRCPPVPEGVKPLQVITGSLDDILKDPRFNPRGKRLSALDGALAIAEVTRAQGELNTLQSESRLEMIQGMEKLRPLGAFVEYAPGEKYLKEEGVLTSAETTDAGTLRMFHLPPDEFPEIYEKKRKTEEIAEAALRRLLSILEG